VARRKASSEGLQQRLGYVFQDPDLLTQALTHVSAAPRGPGSSYQRLEFLGDRVLGLAIADLLYAAFPGAPEGELSRRLSELVRREACAEIAVLWDVGPHLKLGSGEVQSGGRRNQAILADAAEAILGAVYLDGGFAPARELVARAYGERVGALTPAMRDPKSALQEWAQGQGLPPPTYTIVEQVGPDHAPNFRVSAKVKGLEPALGAGASRRGAEQAAARSLLLRERVWTEAENVDA
jgi:ribonuclease III